MKLPAIALVTAFAAGIATGFWPALVKVETTSSQFLVWSFTLAALSLAAAGFFVSRSLPVAGFLSLVAWATLGLCGAALAQQPVPDSHVLRLIERGDFDSGTPLRRSGRLRDEPTSLPWGIALDLQLDGVYFEERFIPLQGGLRLNYSPRAEDRELPEVHEGDSVTAVVQARLPLVFRDEGAFDRRAHLRDQGIDLTAAPLPRTFAARRASAALRQFLARAFATSSARGAFRYVAFVTTGSWCAPRDAAWRPQFP